MKKICITVDFTAQIPDHFTEEDLAEITMGIDPSKVNIQIDGKVVGHPSGYMTTWVEKE